MNVAHKIPNTWLPIVKDGAPSKYVNQGHRTLRKAVDDGLLRAARVGGRGQLLTTFAWLDEYVERTATPVEVFPIRRKVI